MGRVSSPYEKFKSASASMIDRFHYKSIPTLSHIRMRPYFLGSVFHHSNNPRIIRRINEGFEDMKQERIVIGSMFPSLYNGIRLGNGHRAVSDFELRTANEPIQASSNFQNIPIKIHYDQFKKNTKSLCEESPIILDDDFTEVVDCTTEDFTEVVDCTTDDSTVAPTRDIYQFKRSDAASNKGKTKTDTPFVLDDEDTQELLLQGGLSQIGSKCALLKLSTGCPSEKGKANTRNAVIVEDAESTVVSPVSQKSSRDNTCSGKKHFFLTNSIIIEDDATDQDVDISDTDTSKYPSSYRISSMKATDDHVKELGDSLPPGLPVYEMLMKTLAREDRMIHHITGDGNCFFRALGKILYGCENYHKLVRRHIVGIISTNKSKFAQFIDGKDIKDHIVNMSRDHYWATTCEIYAAATILQRDIFMFTPDQLNKNYSWLLFKPLLKLSQVKGDLPNQQCYITLCNTNGNHFDIIMANHGKCNCFLPHPELEGINAVIDLTQ